MGYEIRYTPRAKNQEFRSEYYEKRREYKKLIKSKKVKFMFDLSQDIADGTNIN